MPDSTTLIAWISWALTLVSHVRYNFGRRSPWNGGHQDDVAFTPFTSAYFAVWAFWLVQELAQITYLTKFFHQSSHRVKTHFILSNLLLLTWSYLFSRSHFIWSEIIMIIAFLSYILGYFSTHSARQRSLKEYLSTHLGVFAWPLAWANYVILWNGAVIFHARDLPSRIIANVLIWELLVTPLFYLVVFGDYAVGFGFAAITFALALGQFATKIFALQWIFALIIASLDAVLSLVYSVSPPSGAERIPLLNGEQQEVDVIVAAV